MDLSHLLKFVTNMAETGAQNLIISKRDGEVSGVSKEAAEEAGSRATLRNAMPPPSSASDIAGSGMVRGGKSSSGPVAVFTSIS